MMNGLTVLGLSRPSGPTIFGHHAPRAPWAARAGLGVRQLPAVPVHAPFEQLRPAPQGEVAGVPEVHLGVELAVPAVGEQAFLLRRPLTGGVHRGEVLRQHDAPFELRRPRIGAAREVDDTAAAPVRGPRRGDGGAGGFGGG